MKLRACLGLLLALTLVGCSSGSDTGASTAVSATTAEASEAATEVTGEGNVVSARQTEAEATEESTTEAPKEAEISDDNLEIVKEYSIKTSEYSDYTHHVIVVKNNNDTQVALTSNSKAYDVNGELLGIGNATANVLGAGATTVLDESIESIDGVASYETKVIASEAKYYKEIDSAVAIELDASSSKVFVTLTNNGTEAAEFVDCFVVFLDENGNGVDFEEKYIVDNDSEIKAGQSLSNEFKTDKAFSTAEVYITGRITDL